MNKFGLKADLTSIGVRVITLDNVLDACTDYGMADIWLSLSLRVRWEIASVLFHGGYWRGL